MQAIPRCRRRRVSVRGCKGMRLAPPGLSMCSRCYLLVRTSAGGAQGLENTGHGGPTRCTPWRAAYRKLTALAHLFGALFAVHTNARSFLYPYVCIHRPVPARNHGAFSGTLSVIDAMTCAYCHAHDCKSANLRMAMTPSVTKQKQRCKTLIRAIQ